MLIMPVAPMMSGMRAPPPSPSDTSGNPFAAA